MKATHISMKNASIVEKRFVYQGFPVIPLILLGSGFIFVYYQVIWMMIVQWWTDEMYSYCFLVPFVSFYMIWVRRASLYGIQRYSNGRLGIFALLLGLIMLLTGYAGQISAIQQLSIIPVITGIILLIFGLFFLRKIWISVAYLLFMLPIWEFITDRLHFPFQTLSANIGVALVGSLGIPAYKHGVYLELPNITLEVARACSGINYLIAVAALGIPMAHLFLDRWIKKMFLVASAIMIAVFANGLRVSLIGILSYYGITKEIHGPSHILHGLFVSFVGYGAIFGGLWLMSGNRLRTQGVPSQADHKQFIDSVILKRNSLRISILISAIVLFILIGSYINFYKINPVPLKADFKLFPDRIEQWTGTDMSPNSLLANSSEADGVLSRMYRLASGHEAIVNISYFASQNYKKKLVTFDHERTQLHQAAMKAHVTIAQNEQIVVNKIIRTSETGSSLIFFWYDINGRIIRDRFMAKMYNVWDILISRKNNGAIIVVSFKLDDNNDPESAMLRGTRFISVLHSKLDVYIP